MKPDAMRETFLADMRRLGKVVEMCLPSAPCLKDGCVRCAKERAWQAQMQEADRDFFELLWEWPR